MSSFRLAWLATVLLGLGWTLPTQAAFVVSPGDLTGVEGDSNNGYPLNLSLFDNINSMRYQQVYDASDFASLGGPIRITSIAFRLDEGSGSFSSLPITFRIDLSTTNAQVNGLSLTFADNIGSDNTTVFDDSISLSSSSSGSGPRPFDILIPLSTPFIYNPALGNLLMDVRNFSGGGTAQFDSTNRDNDTTSRVYNFDVEDNMAATSDVAFFPWGLVTRFEFDPAPPTPPVAQGVPAPASALLLAFGGISALGLRLRRKAA